MPATKKRSSSTSSRSKSSSSSRKKSSGRKYGRKAQQDVKKEMHEFKRGEARSGPGGKGGKVKSRKQAIAIGLSKARKEGAKVPQKKAA
jgi:transglutaminase/protease-like cytokinesis protein 3